MKNRSDKSPVSLASLLNTVRLPIEAWVRSIFSSHQQRPPRSITMLVVVGAVGCAIGLVSVQVKAGQASAERAEMARAQAELDAALEAKSRAEAGQGGVSATSLKAQKSARSEEAAALRRKLDILEQLLVRNQEENAQLRQQLKTLMAQNKNAASHGALGQDNLAKMKMLERAAQESAAIDKMRAQEAQAKADEVMRAAQEISLAQKQAAEALVNDLKQQMVLLQKQLLQADALYRSGHTTSQEITRMKAELDAARARLEAAQAQLNAAQAGQKISRKEQNVAQLRLEIAEQKARLQQAQANLSLVKAHYEAGTVSAAEVQATEANIKSIEITIDQLQLKLMQEGGR